MNIKSPWLSDGTKSRSKGHAVYRAGVNKTHGECDRCKGLGKIILGGGIAVWKCFSCSGTGRQTEADILRNTAYNKQLDAKIERVSSVGADLFGVSPQQEPRRMTLAEAAEKLDLLVRVCLNPTCGHSSVVELESALSASLANPEWTIQELERRSRCSRCSKKLVRVILQSAA